MQNYRFSQQQKLNVISAPNLAEVFKNAKLLLFITLSNSHQTKTVDLIHASLKIIRLLPLFVA